ncbi:MAG: hypothetical protein LBG83_02160 [Oscillospiraceae bacterium]|jgi:hypothetical protein|nr:hypothetical protein [Oscillospiraceae bacterium]
MDFDAYTGASGAIPRNDLGRMDDHAKRYYEEIRKRDSDIAAIAKNTGFSPEEITDIKNHIFQNAYDLGEAEPQRFDPDYDMAVSWQRLVEGKNIQEMDLVLLRHEKLEQDLMAQGLPYYEAHKQAEALHNYTHYVEQLNQREGLR